MNLKKIAFFWIAVSTLLCPVLSYSNSWLLGAELGYLFRNASFDATTVNASSAVATATGYAVGAPMAAYGFNFTDSGGIMGAFIGHEWDQHPSLVATLELGMEWESDGKYHQHLYPDARQSGSLFVGQVYYNRGSRVELMGHLGIKTDTMWFPYVVAGAMTCTDSMSYSVSLTNGAFSAFDTAEQQKRMYGWIAGLGVEWPLFIDSIVPLLKMSTVRAEYNYIRTKRFTMYDYNVPLFGVMTANPAENIWKVALVFKHS